MKTRDLFLLGWKRFYLILIAWFIAVILHNVIYALTEFEEPFFIIIAVAILPLYLLFCILYTLKQKRKR